MKHQLCQLRNHCYDSQVAICFDFHVDNDRHEWYTIINVRRLLTQENHTCIHDKLDGCTLLCAHKP